MKLAILAAVAVLGCSGGGGRGAAGPGAAPAASADGVLRWLPARPTYAVVARTVRDAQRALVDAVDALAILGDVDVPSVSAELRRLLGVDPLSADVVADLGVDLDGAAAVFSDAVNPTFVVALAQPALFQAFVDRQRAQGLATRSVVVDGVEVTSTQVGDVRISWAAADGWLWVHFALPVVSDDGTRWFTASRAADPPAWRADWQAAAPAGAPPALVGFLDLGTLLSTVSARVSELAACARLLAPVGRVALAFDGGPAQARARVALELGEAAAGAARAIRPAPDGWAAVAARAPLAAQWNVDLDVVRAWAAPCLAALAVDTTRLDEIGLRTARVLLLSLDPKGPAGSGAVSADLSHRRFVDHWLGRIPLRSTLERARTFGRYAGRTLSIPFGPSIDYVLTDQLGMVAMGEGVLAQIAGSGAPGAAGAPQLAVAVDVSPRGLTEESWRFLFDLIGLPPRAVAHLGKWRDAHLRVTIEGARLVLEATGNRR